MASKAVLLARDVSQAAIPRHAEQQLDKDAASWRERALNAEALAKALRATVKDRDARIADLTGQLYDPEGTHLADENARLHDLVHSLNKSLQQTQLENSRLRRSLDGARANVKRERGNAMSVNCFPSRADLDHSEGRRSRGSS
jgi:hypothetical protein